MSLLRSRFVVMSCFVSIAALAGCSNAPTVEPDAGVDVPCRTDGDCDDGRFCNGAEQCAPDAGSADERGCVPGAAPCAAAACDESANACTGDCVDPDVDGDGADSPACGGGDCDDEDPRRAPGLAEICDAEDVDEDCDDSTFGVRDLDADGEADALCCNVAEDGTRTCGRDCDDTRAGVGPTSPEVCNAIDDDCDGAIDEGLLTRRYRDSDGDTYGDDADFRDDLCGPDGLYLTIIGGDCDDEDAAVYPGAREICNAVDDDCSSGGGAEPAEDRDDDGHTSTTYTACEPIPSALQRDDCDDTNPLVHPGATYQSWPRCAVGEACRRVPPRPAGWACGVRVAGTADCASELGSGSVSWDFDCSSTEDIEPAIGLFGCRWCDLGPDACTACLVFDATGRSCLEHRPQFEVFHASGGTSCGTDAIYASCTGDCDTCGILEMTQPLRCR